MHDESTAVLIVGGGPVGLSAAMFLTRQGVRPILVERHACLSTIPRATGLHARTLELLREAGLEAQVAELGMEMVSPGTNEERVRSGRATPTVMLGAATLADIDTAIVLESHNLVYEEFTPSRAIWCGQDLYEPLLLDAARSRGADVRFSTEFRSLEQDGDAVTAVVRNRETGEHRNIRAQFLLAADGIRSPIRTALGIGQSSHGDAGEILSIIFRAKIDLPPDAPRFTWFAVFHRQILGLLLPMETDRWMFSVINYAERGLSAADFTPEYCVEVIRIATGMPDLEVVVESAKPWAAVHMVADAYRVGRVFLAGDACHAHPPSGGFGVNAGMQDAHNLAWKLGAVLHGWADDSLLDTYEAERRPVGAATAEQAWLYTKSRLNGLTEQEEEDLRDILPVTAGYRYNSEAVIGEGGSTEVVPKELEFTGRPGSRVPHAWLQLNGAQVSTLDLLGAGFVLLTSPNADECDWAAAGDRVAAALRIPLRCYRLGPEGDAIERDRRWPNAYGVSDTGAVLVRPDGFVAWRAPAAAADPDRILGDVLSRVVGRMTALSLVG